MNDIEKILEAVGNPKQEKDLFGDRWVLLPGGQFRVMDIPNDLNAIREMELLVIEKVGASQYLQRLIEACKFTFDEEPYMKSVKMITADAKTRIAAMLAALEKQ